jgi:hypothetical protein
MAAYVNLQLLQGGGIMLNRRAAQQRKKRAKRKRRRKVLIQRRKRRRKPRPPKSHNANHRTSQHDEAGLLSRSKAGTGAENGPQKKMCRHHVVGRHDGHPRIYL